MCRTTLDWLPEAVILVDERGRITFANREAGRLLRIRDTGRGRPHIRGFIPDTRTETTTRLIAAARSLPAGQTARFSEVELQTGDGLPIAVDLSLSRMSGVRSLFAVALQDITQRKAIHERLVRMLSDQEERRLRIERQAAEIVEQAEALSASERRLSLIIQSVNDGCWDWDIVSGLVHFNSRLGKMLDLPGAGPLPFAVVLSRVIDSDAPAMDDAIQRHFRGEVDGLSQECRMIGPGGRLSWMKVRGQVTSRDAQGRPLRAAGLVSDISEQKRHDLEQVREQKLLAIGELAAGVAHEINTPLQFVGDNLAFLAGQCHRVVKAIDMVIQLQRQVAASPLWSALYAKQFDLPEGDDLAYLRREVPDAISESLAGVERVAQIVLALKEFSHPSDADFVYADVNRVAENAITLSRHEWKHVADVEKTFDADLPPVYCIPHECCRLLVNLIVNSAHAIADVVPNGAKGVIAVQTRLSGPDVTIEVSDNGSGIPAEIRDRIFDPFFTTKPVGQGTGQGLALTRTIVARHGGRIALDTEVGRGTVFSVQFPLCPSGASREANTAR